MKFVNFKFNQKATLGVFNSSGKVVNLADLDINVRDMNELIINFDEFKSCDFIDFISLDEILNILSDACIDFAKVECKSNMAKDVIKAFEDVCVTPLFQSIIIKIQKSLKEALDAKPEDYQNLRNKQCSILPQEFAADFLEF